MRRFLIYVFIDLHFRSPIINVHNSCLCIKRWFRFNVKCYVDTTLCFCYTTTTWLKFGKVHVWFKIHWFEYYFSLTKVLSEVLNQILTADHVIPFFIVKSIVGVMRWSLICRFLKTHHFRKLVVQKHNKTRGSVMLIYISDVILFTGSLWGNVCFYFLRSQKGRLSFLRHFLKCHPVSTRGCCVTVI